MEEEHGGGGQRVVYDFAHQLREAIDVAEHYQDGDDLEVVNWCQVAHDLSWRMEADPDLEAVKPHFTGPGGSSCGPRNDHEWIAQFSYLVHQRFETWREATEWAAYLMASSEPGALEESRQLRLLEARRIVGELGSVTALQERADRGLAKALETHEIICNPTACGEFE